MEDIPKPADAETQETASPEPEAPDQATLHQDGFRKVYLGQVSDPIFPSHPEPPEAPEDELTQQAIHDPDAGIRDAALPAPLFWRVLFLVFLAVVALAIVFWRWR